MQWIALSSSFSIFRDYRGEAYSFLPVLLQPVRLIVRSLMIGDLERIRLVVEHLGDESALDGLRRSVEDFVVDILESPD